MKVFTNEIVFRGHPDKVCDQIAGAILTECLAKDKNARVAVECAIKDEKLWIFGEVTINAEIDYTGIAKRVLNDIGYKEQYDVRVGISQQSPDIALGVNVDGAGDNGVMFGFACDDDNNEACLPQAQVILQNFAKEYDKLVHKFPNEFFPDGKAEITATYDSNNTLVTIDTFTICYCNPETERAKSDLILKNYATYFCGEFKPECILINPTGKFNIGGSFADSGLTGRKIVVDAYQGFAKVGGGSMNGKDPSKVDLTGAYKARELAVRYLKKLKAKWCEVQLAYAIGKAYPLSICVTTEKGTLKSIPESIYKECTPKCMIEDLKMREINYEEAAKFGHFGIAELQN